MTREAKGAPIGFSTLGSLGMAIRAGHLMNISVMGALARFSVTTRTVCIRRVMALVTTRTIGLCRLPSACVARRAGKMGVPGMFESDVADSRIIPHREGEAYRDH